jgi:hypothetical protein
MSRAASRPVSSMARVTVDGVLSNIATFYALKVVPPEIAMDVETLCTILLTAAVATVGKKLREKGSLFGEVI